MGFGMKVKVDVPKVDVAGAVDGVKDAVSGAVDSATSAVSDAVESAKDAVNGAVDAATDAVNDVKESLSSVAGAIADVAVSFTGAIEDIALEPHLQLDANASFGKTNFEKGPIWIRVEMPVGEANDAREKLRLFSTSGSYNQKKQMKDYIESTPDTIDVLFEDVPMNENYTLEIIRPGKKRTMFKDIPYGDLRKKRSQY